MTEQKIPATTNRKRVNQMKQGILIIASLLILASVILNVVLMVRVIQLNHLVAQLYGAVTGFPLL